MLSEALARVDPARRAFFGSQAALALADAGLADDARAKIAENAERWPDDVRTRILAGDALALLGDAEAALAQYQAALPLAQQAKDYRASRQLSEKIFRLTRPDSAPPGGAAPPAALQANQIAAQGSAITASGSGFLPDREVLVAVAGKRLPGPAVPPFTQPHPGELGHQVWFRRPHVPEPDRGVLATLNVVPAHALRGRVVGVDDSLPADVPRQDVLSRRQPAQLGDPDLDDEAAAGLQVRRDGAEARDLRLLRR